MRLLTGAIRLDDDDDLMLYTTTDDKFLQFDWFRAVVFQLNLKYLHVKITNLLRVVVCMICT